MKTNNKELKAIIAIALLWVGIIFWAIIYVAVFKKYGLWLQASFNFIISLIGLFGTQYVWRYFAYKNN